MTRPMMLGARAAVAATGALCFATSMTATACAAEAQTPPASPPPAADASTVTMSVKDRTLVFGQEAVVRGGVSGAPAGVVVTLELQLPDGTWLGITQGHTTDGGIYVLRAALPASGAVRVVAAGAQVRAGSLGGSPPPVSGIARIAVAPDVVARRRHLDVLAGRRALLQGAIRPALGGRRVRLQRRTRRGWATIARERTRRNGTFALSAVMRRPFSAALRVTVAGGLGYVAGREAVGRLNVFRPALASWYGPGFWGGHLACGGILRPGLLGVANKWLPCGTMITLRYGRRSVRVPVIDRGPYVGGREFDLTAATKDRLHFGGVGTVLVTE